MSARVSAPFWPLFAAAIALVVFIASQGKHAELAALAFRDPDDALRLAQVRDWMAGQGWFDVSQHRMNGTGGGLMHWSRLVDLPIALVIWIAGAFADSPQAERIALVVVPLATLTIALALLGLIARRLVGDDGTLLVIVLVIASITVLRQFEPMRIDHHGWQATAALAMTLGLMAERRSLGAFLAGLAAAAWLAISIEGLPFAAAALGLVVVRYAWSNEAGPLRGYAVGLALGSVGLTALTRGAAVLEDRACDALTMAYLPSITAAAVGVTILLSVSLRSTPSRIMGLVAVALALGWVLMGSASACAGGPFAALDPLVEQLWYLRIDEGLPLWRLTPSLAAVSMLLPAIGLICSIAAWRHTHGAHARNWATVIALLVAALVATALLNRFDTVAKLLALPGGVAAITLLRNWARRQRHVAGWAVAGASIVLVALPMPVLAIALAIVDPRPDGGQIGCMRPREIAALDQLATPARLLAPLDIGPAILVETRHSVLATGHHRNADAMRDVIATFTGSSDEARRIAARTRVQYIVICPEMTELDGYVAAHRNGFASRLTYGIAPSWLEPVRLQGTTLRIWRVR